MRVLVTRPAPGAARTQARLLAAGHEARVASLLVIRPLEAPWPAGLVDGLLATSAAAFEGPLVGGPSAEVRRLLPLFLVGERTTGAARAAGFGGAATVCADARTLAATLGPLVRRARLVYLAGRDRKPHLEAALGGTRRLHVRETYAADAATRLPDTVDADLAAGRIDAVLHYSARTAAVFLTLAGARAAGPAHYCLSLDAAGPLLDAGLPRVYAADQPDETALLALLGGGSSAP